MLEYLRKRQREAKAQEVGTEQTVVPAGMSNQAMISMLESQQARQAARPASGGTPLADAMRAKFERQFGLPLDDVRVYHNSAEPAKFDAGAYTYGTDIFIGPGQEELLNHEMTHVAQQKLGQVRPTGMEHGLAVNRSPALEHSADTGAVPQTMGTAAGPVVQCGPNDTFIPDTNEPHLHCHGNGVTFTDVHHHHTYLERGERQYERNIANIYYALMHNEDERSQTIRNEMMQRYGDICFIPDGPQDVAQQVLLGKEPLKHIYSDSGYAPLINELLQYLGQNVDHHRKQQGLRSSCELDLKTAIRYMLNDKNIDENQFYIWLRDRNPKELYTRITEHSRKGSVPSQVQNRKTIKRHLKRKLIGKNIESIYALKTFLDSRTPA